MITYATFKNNNVHKIYTYVITPSGKTEFREVDLAVANLDLSEIVQSARNIVTQRPGDQKETNRSATGMETNQFTVGEYVKLKGEFPTDEPWQITAIDQEKGIVTLDQTLREAPLENVSLERIASKTNTPLQQLHQILIEPIADLLPRNPTEKVIFMPQGALFGVPFPALQDKEGTYLLEKHTILTSPSIQVLAQTAQQNQRIAQQNKADHQPLIVGNPYPYPQGLASLENARQEAIDIANLLGTQPLLGQKATKAQVLAQMPKADILHFATHASFNDQNGIQSAIYLTAEPGAPDDGLFQTPGRITAEEIFNQFENNPLNASIAVLSACDTGQGEITGDGVIGLSRSLIAAGAPSVLVSLWSVNDASTKTLMTEFYRQWQTERVDKATALRNAMLKLKEQYPEPYYWGAFTLIGEAD
ncbi:CHAT domain-containing protein [Synechocystis sp. CACIAM 05]|uniref:CHAT domain-containing protein n=1 Tax=Synechocystis sp. CACIAM 05 TaxID=1933929 RepID=UPI001F204DC5|nr:CHAT domain-containing protein [Synechocystis sp. CACIAM 05]